MFREETESSKLFTDINNFNKTQTCDGRVYWCDGLAIAAAIDPSIVTKSIEAYGEVVTEGKITAGSIFYNMYPEFVKSDGPNIVQLNEIDHDKYIDMLENALGLSKE